MKNIEKEKNEATQRNEALLDDLERARQREKSLETFMIMTLNGFILTQQDIKESLSTLTSTNKNANQSLPSSKDSKDETCTVGPNSS